MTKSDFLNALAARLGALSEIDIARSLDYYEEMIDDRMDDGMTEEEKRISSALSQIAGAGETRISIYYAAPASAFGAALVGTLATGSSTGAGLGPTWVRRE